MSQPNQPLHNLIPTGKRRNRRCLLCKRRSSLPRQVWDSAQSFAPSLSRLKERPHTKWFQDASSCAQSIWFTLIMSGPKKKKKKGERRRERREGRRDGGRLLHHPDKICSDPKSRLRRMACGLTPPAPSSSWCPERRAPAPHSSCKHLHETQAEPELCQRLQQDLSSKLYSLLHHQKGWER